MAAWLHDLPLDFSRSDTREAERILVQAYANPWEAGQFLQNVGLSLASLPMLAPTTILLRKAMEAARNAGRLPRMLAELLQDSAKEEYAKRMAELVRGCEAELQAAWLDWKPSLASLARLPPSASVRRGEEAPRSLAQGFEALINPAAGFTDLALFRNGLSIAEVRTARVSMGGKAKGTGFLVGDSLMLTNWHVVAFCANAAEAQFDHLVSPAGNVVREGRKVKFAPQWNVAHSPHDTKALELGADGPQEGTCDYALVRLNEPVGAQPPGGGAANGERRGHYRLDPDEYTFDANESVLIVGHPNGRPMQLSLAAPASATPTRWKTRIRYATNTEPGSSGSPVFNKEFRLVALHHAAGPTSEDGPVNVPEGGKFNQGIPISLLVADLRTRLAERPDGPQILNELGLA